ncbi:phosphorylase [Trinickia sp. LjRoot230]|uniref:ATP adenylyltransferase family protein n=1 Tax=Trinickia sp. LjRoot230 TaxID=3342288 RepID=UPI003ECEC144
MPFAFFRPGTLWATIVDRSRHALATGALHSIETVSTTIEDGGVSFIVRQVSSLARKAQRRAAGPNTGLHVSSDPFAPYEPDLFVADISPTHIALLNKFNVIDYHLLVVTRAFEEQQTLLGLVDFEAWCACLAEFDGLGFYNGGVEAGASQRHKHMQIVPLPIGDGQVLLPIAPLIAAAQTVNGIGKLPALPFAHAFARLQPSGSHEQAARVSLDCYLRLMEALDLHDRSGGAAARQRGPYNLLLTRHWMLAVPRTMESVDAISINALGFAGSLFVHNVAQMDHVRKLGPMTLLQRVARGR